MKAHIARNQYAGTPAVLEWNLSPSDRGILDGMSAAFGMKTRAVLPEEADRTVEDLLGDLAAVPPAGVTSRLPGSSVILLANFREKDLDTLLDLLKTAKCGVQIKAAATETNRRWRFCDLVEHLEEEHRAMAAAQTAGGRK